MAAYGTMGGCSSTMSATYSVTESPTVGFNTASIGEGDAFQGLFSAGPSGAVAGKIDQHYEVSTSITAGSPLTITLGATGTTPNPPNDGLSRTVGFKCITGMWIRLTDTTPGGYLTLTPGSHPFAILTGTTPAMPIYRFWMWVNDTAAQIALTANSTDQIILTASAGTLAVKIGIIGTTAA